MRSKPTRIDATRRGIVAVLCAIAIAGGDAAVFAAAPQPLPAQDAASAIPPDQLDSLVAPIALYPDPLLAQTLAASTYPLEIMQLQQWLSRNPGLTGSALASAVEKQPWDASVQAMANMPDVVKRLADDIQWTTDLGNAFLAQQADVMNAVQRMRQKAQGTGNLQSGPQQTVQTEVVQDKTVIVIEPSSPETIYVPSYDPTIVYGPPVYPYPSIYYPPPGYYAAGAAISWGVGVAMGAAWGGGGWGWDVGWGDNDININSNNNFIRNENIRANRTDIANNRWQHRPEHRGGTPYRDRTTADRFGGAARGDSLANRQAGARQQLGRQGGNVRSGAVGTTGIGDRTAGGVGNRTGGVGDRSAAGGLGNRTGAGGLGDRAGSTGLSNRPGSVAGGADRIGSRDLSRGSGGGGAFGGGSGGFNGASARANRDRGSSSIRSSGSRGGVSRGGFGGGSRGGGGRSRGGGGRRR